MKVRNKKKPKESSRLKLRSPKEKASKKSVFQKDHTKRPWGNYYKLFQDAGVWVKRVEVKPHARLSLQQHQKRSEKWIVVSGRGLAIVDNKEIAIEPGIVVDVPLKAAHRIGNNGDMPLVFIEVACGSYLGEDDIIRLQDDYCRPA